MWYRIQSPLSRRTRVCAWDPAGLGFSSPSPEPQDTVHETEDLEQALKVAHIDGPYVMVAHSAGAYIAIRFADQHRRTWSESSWWTPLSPTRTRFGNVSHRSSQRSAAGRRGRKPSGCVSVPPSFEAAL